jgi:hypothetical protein
MTLADDYATRIKRLHAAIRAFLKEMYAVGSLDKPKLGKSPAKQVETFRQFALRTIPGIIENADATAQRAQQLPLLLKTAAENKQLSPAQLAAIEKLAKKARERLFMHLINIREMFARILHECASSSRAPTTLLQTVRVLIDQSKDLAEIGQARTESLVRELIAAEDLIEA